MLNKTLDITVIILTYNEEIHIRRCLENVTPFAKKVFVVDSPSTDRTVEICREFENVEVVVHKYPGNQAEQFNWALDTLQIETEWILRLDADEYLLPELVEELKERLPVMPEGVSALSLSRARARVPLSSGEGGGIPGALSRARVPPAAASPPIPNSARGSSALP